LQESFSPIVIPEEEGARELLSLAGQDWNRQREACLDRVKSARGASFTIGSKRSRGVDACLSHREEARAAKERRLRVVIQGKEGNGAERLGDRADAAINRSAEQSREARGLCRREASREPGLMPWELLGAIKAESEGESKAPSLAIGEADGP
jgi:hypothetical protein